MSYPLKMNFRSEWKALLLLLASLVSGIYFYQHFPNQIVSHWNSIGQPNGYLDKFWGAFIGFCFLLGLYLLFIFLPAIDPQKEKYQSFQRSFFAIRDIVLFFIFTLFFGVGLYNLGYMIDVPFLSLILIGILLAIIGRYIKNVKKNWFIGIRTPWTMSSDHVWNKANHIGGKLFEILGLCTIVVTLLINDHAIWFMLISLVAVMVFLTVYSYLEFQKERKQ